MRKFTHPATAVGRAMDARGAGAEIRSSRPVAHTLCPQIKLTSNLPALDFGEAEAAGSDGLFQRDEGLCSGRGVQQGRSGEQIAVLSGRGTGGGGLRQPGRTRIRTSRSILRIGAPALDTLTPLLQLLIGHRGFGCGCRGGEAEGQQQLAGEESACHGLVLCCRGQVPSVSK